MADEWDAKLQRLRESYPRRVTRTRKLIELWTTFLSTYRGGLPRGVFAAFMQMESDGSPSSPGDAQLGEVGLFQITESWAARAIGDAAARTRSDVNCYLGGLEYNYYAARWSQEYAKYVIPCTRDSYMLARLSFAIGHGGATKHASAAIRKYGAGVARGELFTAIVRLVDDGGAMQAGTQSPRKVWYRVHAVALNVAYGEEAEPGAYGCPTAPPAPAGITPNASILRVIGSYSTPAAAPPGGSASPPASTPSSGSSGGLVALALLLMGLR